MLTTSPMDSVLSCGDGYLIDLHHMHPFLTPAHLVVESNRFS